MPSDHNRGGLDRSADGQKGIGTNDGRPLSRTLPSVPSSGDSSLDVGTHVRVCVNIGSPCYVLNPFVSV